MTSPHTVLGGGAVTVAGYGTTWDVSIPGDPPFPFQNNVDFSLIRYTQDRQADGDPPPTNNTTWRLVIDGRLPAAVLSAEIFSYKIRGWDEKNCVGEGTCKEEIELSPSPSPGMPPVPKKILGPPMPNPNNNIVSFSSSGHDGGDFVALQQKCPCNDNTLSRSISIVVFIWMMNRNSIMTTIDIPCENCGETPPYIVSIPQDKLEKIEAPLAQLDEEHDEELIRLMKDRKN